jgi:hypothetical protein
MQSKFILYVLGVIVSAFLGGIGVVTFLDERTDKRLDILLERRLPDVFLKLVKEGKIIIPSGGGGNIIYQSEELTIDSDREGELPVSFPKPFDYSSVTSCFVTIIRTPEKAELPNIRYLEAVSSESGIKVKWLNQGHARFHVKVFAITR